MTRLLPFAASLLLSLPVFAGERFDEVHPISPDAVVEVENMRGLIRVEAGTRQDVRVQGSLGTGAEGLRVKGDARRLSIKIEYPERGGGWFGGWGMGSDAGDSELVVALPSSVSLVVNGVAARIEVSGPAGKRVEINTVSGDIQYSGSAAELELATVSGSARIEGSARDVNLGGVSGDITLDAQIAERLRVESVSGDLDLRSPTALKQVQANVVSGDLELRLALAPGGRLVAEALSGDLLVRLPASTSARLSANSFSGDIRSDAGKVEKEEYGPGSSLRATLGEGDGDVRLESFSGDLSLVLE